MRSWVQPQPKQLFAFVLYVHGHINLYIQCMYLVYTWSEHDLSKYVHKVCKNNICMCIYLV